MSETNHEHNCYKWVVALARCFDHYQDNYQQYRPSLLSLPRRVVYVGGFLGKRKVVKLSSTGPDDSGFLRLLFCSSS